MKKFFMAALVAAFLCVPAIASAEDDVQDVSKVTCKELLDADQNSMAMMLSWIDGYMSAKSNNTLISNAWMEKLGEHIGTYCSANPNKTIMDAMEAVPAE